MAKKPRPLKYDQCLALMRKHDPQLKEDGFHELRPRAADHVLELMRDFRAELDHGLRCWLLELIGAARSPLAFDLLVEQLGSPDESFRHWAAAGLQALDTPEARRALYDAGVRPDRAQSPTEVIRLVAAANAARWQIDGSGRAEEPSGVDAERQLDALFRTSHTLAVYGTLAPGQPNHHVVAPLGGEWTDGLIEGDLFPVGWGAPLGYPAFRPRVGGAAVAVQVLTAPMLATAWSTLDRFEGPEYWRILVPVFSPGLADERRLYTVANLYAAAEASPGAAAL